MKKLFTARIFVGFLSFGALVTLPSLAFADMCQQQKCQQAHEEAVFNCDEKNNADIQNVSSLANMASGMMSQSGADSAQASCGQTNDISNQAAGALNSYKMQCQQAIDKCKQSCQGFVDKTNQLKDCKPLKSQAQQELQRCSSEYEPKVQQANQGIQNYNNAQAQATSCQSETSGKGGEMPEFKLPEMKGDEKKEEKEKEKTYCEQNPDFAGCKAQDVVNCADPAQANTHKTCVCATNPKNPMCGLDAGEVAAESLGVSEDKLKEQLAGTPQGDRPEELPGRSVRANEAARVSGGSSGGVSSASSGGGGSVGGSAGSSSSSSSGSGSKDADVAGARSALAADNGGDSGGSGGGGGGGWGGSYGSGDSEASGTLSTARRPSSAKTKEQLRDYLPGGPQDPSRIAGKSDDKKRVDGVTGPHSDQWRKIRYRYQVIQPSLLEQP